MLLYNFKHNVDTFSMAVKFWKLIRIQLLFDPASVDEMFVVFFVLGGNLTTPRGHHCNDNIISRVFLCLFACGACVK